MYQTVKKIAGGTFLAVASLLFVFGVNEVQAEEQVVQLATSTFRFNVATGLLNETPYQPVSVKAYRSSFPSTESEYVINDFTGNYGFPLDLYIQDASNTHCDGSDISGSYFTCNVEDLLTWSIGTVPLAGTSWWFVFDLGLAQYQYYQLTKVSSSTWQVVTQPSLNTGYETRLLETEVVGLGTWNLQFDIDYFLKTSEFTPQNRPDTMMITIVTSEQNQVRNNKKLILPLTEGNASTSILSSVDADGDYSVYVNFYNFASGNVTFTRSSIVVNFTVSGGDVVSQETVAMIDGLLNSQPEGYVEAPCGLTSIGGCIQNAFGFLFYPSPNSTDSFAQLYATLDSKFPFAYFTDFNDSIASVFADTTSSSLSLTVPFGVYGDITLISAEQIEAVPLTELVRTLIGALIWLMLGYTIYRRTAKIFTPQQST